MRTSLRYLNNESMIDRIIKNVQYYGGTKNFYMLEHPLVRKGYSTYQLYY